MTVLSRALVSTLLALAPLATLAAAMRSPTLDIQHIDAELRFDWVARQAIARATITLAPRTDTARITLDAGELDISAVRLADGTPLAFSHDGSSRDDALVVNLPRRQPAGVSLTLSISYRTRRVNDTDPGNTWGSSGRGLRFLQPSSAEPSRRRQIWPGGEPGSTRHWLPGFDAPGERRTSELRITVPAALSAIAGGRLVGVQAHDDGNRTWHWKTETPEDHTRTTFVVGEYVEIPQHHERVALRNFGYPDEAAGVAASVVMQPDALRFLERTLGSAYPQGSHAQVFVQELPWNTPGTAISVLTENFVDDLGTHHDFQYLWDGLQTEALAQQWLGGAIGIAGWQHLWLERALAHHLAALYTEHRHGPEEYWLWYVQGNQAATLADWASGTREAVAEPAPSDLAAWSGGNAPFTRGAAVLNLLRHELGHATWLAALRRFVAQQQGRVAATRDLQAAVEWAAGRDMGWFFAQWVFGRGHPVFELDSRWDARRRRLTLEVRQVQQTIEGGAALPFFAGHVDIQLDGAVRRVHLAPRAGNRFSFALPAEPRLVHFDAGGAWIKELRLARSDEALLHQLLTAPGVAARHQAAASLVQRARDTGAPPALRQQVIGALRQVIGGLIDSPPRQRYWRERFNALGQLATLLTPADASAPARIDEDTTALLLRVIASERGWLRAGALRALGLAREPRHAPLYRSLLHDTSDRVVNAAAIALGQSGSPDAFAALSALPAKPSWKNQSLIGALAGLKALRDPRAAALALAALRDLQGARWTLATPVWDFRLAAAETLAALADTAEAERLVLGRLEQALAEKQVHDTFSQLQLLVALAHPGASDAVRAVWKPLRERWAHDGVALKAVQSLEADWAAKARRH